MSTKKVQMWADSAKTVQLYPQTSSEVVLHGDSTLDKVVDGKADVVDITDYLVETKSISGNGVYVKNGIPLDKCTTYASDTNIDGGNAHTYLVFTEGKFAGLITMEYYVFMYDDTKKTYIWKKKYSYTDAPFYVKSLFSTVPLELSELVKADASVNTAYNYVYNNQPVDRACVYATDKNISDTPAYYLLFRYMYVETDGCYQAYFVFKRCATDDTLYTWAKTYDKNNVPQYVLNAFGASGSVPYYTEITE